MMKTDEENLIKLKKKIKYIEPKYKERDYE